MSRDQLSDDGTPTVDTDALGAWVAETAAKKGVSERELLDELLSSYWVLEELSDVVLNGEPTDSDDPPRRETPPEPTPQSGAADHREHTPANRGQPSADSDPTPATEQPAAATDSDDTLELSGIEQELEKLRTVINELATEGSLPTPEGPPTATQSASSDAGASATTQQGDEAAEFEEFTPATTESWSESRGVIAELDDELVEIRRRLSELETELTDRVAAEADEREELETWIETEFDNIEDVLQHLLSTTDNLEYRLGSAIESQREQLEPLETAHADREQLQAIKNEAIEKSVETAVCDDCGETIDLSLLPEPYCPNCDHQFSGVTESSWWPFTTATLRTAPARRSRPDTAWGNSADTESAAAARHSHHNDQSATSTHTDHTQSENHPQQRSDESGFTWFDD